MMFKKRQLSEQHSLEAAEWFARLQESELAEEDMLRWERWMMASPDNRSIFADLESLWHKFDALKDMPVPDDAELIADDYCGDTPVTQWLEGQQSETPDSNVQPAPDRRRKFIQLAAAAVFGGLAIGIGLWETGRLSGNSAPEQLYVYETGEGEHRNIRLSDGSNITLGAKSSLSSSYMQHRRIIVLDRGEALFQVAHDPARPFVVIAGSGTITAVGTAFNVHRYTQRVVVTVTEGKVEVARMDDAPLVQGDVSHTVNQSQPAQATLIQGQQISYNTEGIMSDVATVNPDDVTTWRDGRLQFLNETLRHVIDDVNRYTSKQIIIGDQEVEDLVFTGTVFNDHIDEWVNGLADIFPIKIMKMNDEKLLITLQQARMQASSE